MRQFHLNSTYKLTKGSLFFFLLVISDYRPTGSIAAQKGKHPKEKGTSYWLVVVVVFYFFVGDLISQLELLKEFCRYRSG